MDCEARSLKCGVCSVKCEVRSEKCEVRSVECEGSSEKFEVWTVKCGVRRVQCEVWSVKTLLRLSLKKSRLSREGHGRVRQASNYRSFIVGKLPPPACPGL